MKPHLCVFQSLVMLSPGTAGDIIGALLGHQGLCAAASSSLPQHRRGHPLHPTIPSASQYKEGRKSLATTQVSAAETCTHKVHSETVLLGQREQDF